MSDEKPGDHNPASIHEDHWCQHPGCKKWGSFGYDRGKGATDWWCMEHRPAAGATGVPTRRVDEPFSVW